MTGSCKIGIGLVHVPLFFLVSFVFHLLSLTLLLLFVPVHSLFIRILHFLFFFLRSLSLRVVRIYALRLKLLSCVASSKCSCDTRRARTHQDREAEYGCQCFDPLSLTLISFFVLERTTGASCEVPCGRRRKTSATGSGGHNASRCTATQP